MGATGHSRRSAAYAKHLESDPEEYARLISSLLIKVTEFFRDPKVFEYLRDRRSRRSSTRRDGTAAQLRVWSAGCSTGEEAYSLAITLAEALGDDAEPARRARLRDRHRQRGHRLRPARPLPAGSAAEGAARAPRALLREVRRRLRGREGRSGR